MRGAARGAQEAEMSGRMSSIKPDEPRAGVGAVGPAVGGPPYRSVAPGGTWCGCLVTFLLALLCGATAPDRRAAAPAVRVAQAEESPIEVEVTTLDGATIRGRLAATFPELVLDGPDREVSLTWAQVLRARVVGAPVRPPESPPAPWRVVLADGSRFYASIGAARDPRRPGSAADTLRAVLPGGHVVSITPDRLRSVGRAAPAAPAAARVREVLAEEAPRQDAVVLARGNKVMVLRGAAQRISAAAVEFAWKGRPLRLAWERIAGLRVADVMPESAPCRVTLRDGTVFAGTVVGGSTTTLRLRGAALGTLPVSWGRIARIDCRSPYATYLSDLTPIRYEFTPLFGFRWPYATDRTLSGRPIRLGGREYARGIVMHSRSVLVYEVGGRYQRFVAVVGILDETGGRGDVTVAVVGDGRILWQATHVRGGAAPQSVAVDIRGVRALSLRVDYGDDLDLSDHACWGQARLVGVAGE